MTQAHHDVVVVTGASAGDGAKVDRLLDLVRDLADKMMVFTQFRETQRVLERRLQEAGIE